MITQYVVCETQLELSNVMQINLGIKGVILSQIPPPQMCIPHLLYV